MGRTGVHGGQRVRDRAAGVVVAVDAHPDTGGLDNVVDHVGHPPRQHPAVGRTVPPPVLDLGGRPEHLEGVVAVRAVAVEEVLGVEEDLLPRPECATVSRTIARFSSRVVRSASSTPVVGLRDTG